MFLMRTTLDERRNLGHRDSRQVTRSTVRRKGLNAELATSYGHGVRRGEIAGLGRSTLYRVVLKSAG